MPGYERTPEICFVNDAPRGRQGRGRLGGAGRRLGAGGTRPGRSGCLAGKPHPKRRATVDAWIRSLSVDQSFKNEVVYPWITALIGSARAGAVGAWARSILQTFALAVPADVAQGATTYNSTIGLQGNLKRLLDRSPEVRVHLSTGAHAWLLVFGDADQPPRALPRCGAERATTRRTPAAADTARLCAPHGVAERI